MKRGDIVVVPSTSTQRLGIGFVEDDKAYEEVLAFEETKFPEFSKRRKVHWLRGVDRWDINPNLINLLLNHQTIVDASAYAEWIDSLLYDLFKKGELYHFVVRVQTKEDIKAQALFRACIDLFDLGEEFAKGEDQAVDFQDINTRINLNSPGNVELWTSGFQTVLVIALLVVLINGGGVEFSWNKGTHKFGLKTEGILKRLTEWLNERTRRKTVEEVRKKLASLDVKDPQMILELLKATKK
jgi:hypothetical protein